MCPIYPIQVNLSNKPLPENDRHLFTDAPSLHPPLQPPLDSGTQKQRVHKIVQRIFVFVLLLSILVVPDASSKRANAQTGDCPLYTSPHQRIGYNVTREEGASIDDYDAARLRAGWYHNYGTSPAASTPSHTQHYQMIRTHTNTDRLDVLIGPIVDANPGDKWILGNEPDRVGQDEMLAADYAVFYHDVYTFLKARDPSSIVSPAGLVQPTPLRLRYLDELLRSYQLRYGVPMPVDEWDIHNFMLREDDTWGAGIPVGFEDDHDDATLFEWTQQADVAIFQQQLRDMRQWMADNGYRNVPLRISEFGILLSPWHGYDYLKVRIFMQNTFDFMLTETDEQTGYPADDNRLVQEFAWFSLNYYAWEPIKKIGSNGNLFDHNSGKIQPLAIDFENYVKSKLIETIDLKLTAFRTDVSQTTTTSTVTLEVDYYNQGGLAAEDVQIRFWNGDPAAGGVFIGSSPVRTTVLPGCQSTLSAELVWVPPEPGSYAIYAELIASNLSLESDTDNNLGMIELDVTVGTGPTITPTPTPSKTVTHTPTPTNIGGVTNTPTRTPSSTATILPTMAQTPTSTSSPTSTSTSTATATPTPTPTETTPIGVGKHKLYMPIIVRD